MYKIFLKGMIAAALILSANVKAVPIVFTGSMIEAEGGVLSARVTFNIVGDILTVILENIANSATDGHASGKDVSGNTLTGVYWDFAPNVTLTPQSATINAGSLIQASKCSIGPCSNTTTNVAGEWGYQESSIQIPTGSSADRGIASSGYLTTGNPSNIGNFGPNGSQGADLDSPSSLDGINFGIISSLAGDPNFNPNTGLKNDPLISRLARFTLSGALGLTNADISDVTFQYGTSFGENHFNVPEPGSVILLLSGLLAMALGRRKVQRVQ